MLARTCEPGCRKKKKIVNILQISLDGQDPCFLGGSSLGVRALWSAS
jgi:hypothetical protein